MREPEAVGLIADAVADVYFAARHEELLKEADGPPGSAGRISAVVYLALLREHVALRALARAQGIETWSLPDLTTTQPSTEPSA